MKTLVRLRIKPLMGLYKDLELSVSYTTPNPDLEKRVVGGRYKNASFTYEVIAIDKLDDLETHSALTLLVTKTRWTEVDWKALSKYQRGLYNNALVRVVKRDGDGIGVYATYEEVRRVAVSGDTICEIQFEPSMVYPERWNRRVKSINTFTY